MTFNDGTRWLILTLAGVGVIGLAVLALSIGVSSGPESKAKVECQAGGDLWIKHDAGHACLTRGATR